MNTTNKKASKPVIAVDFDDVISDQNDAMRRFANKAYGHNHDPKDFSIDGEYWGYWNEIWGVSKQEGHKRIDEFHAAEGTMLQQLLPHAAEVLRELEKNYQLVIVTGRDDHHVEVTWRWLNEYLPKVFHDVKFVNLANGTNKKVTKAEVCKKLGAQYLIDDHIDHCRHVADEGITALLFGEYGWNRNVELPKGAHRVKDWQEVKEFFDGISKKAV